MILGIDFGYYSIKATVLNRGKIHLIGEKSIIEDFSSFDPDKIEVSHWVSAFQELCNEMNINVKKIDKVVSSISGTKVSIKPMTTLEVEEEELMNILTFEAKKHVPLDGSDPVIDYSVLGTDAKEIDKINILLVATTQKIIKGHNSIIKNCNFKNPIFDTDPLAILNCYKYNYESAKDNNVDVLINIGCLTTSILVYGENQEFFTREISIGGHNINLDIMNLHNTNYSEALNLKLEKGMQAFDIDKDNEEENSIKISQRNIVSELSDEIRKTLRYYMKSKAGVSYNQFYISGGLSKMSGLIDSLNTSLQVEFSLLNPFIKFPDFENQDQNQNYAVSVGLALRGTLKD